jgi:phosphate transport system protein
MAVRVEENIDRMCAALESATESLYSGAARVDVEVDAMNVSLTERCYDLIAREAPVAGDLRLVVSVVRMLNELERISDHCVHICRDAIGDDVADDQSRLYDLLRTMANENAERFHLARVAWGAMDLDCAEQLAKGSSLFEALHSRLVRELLELHGDSAVGIALRTSSMGRSLERISDHISVIGARLRYLITGDPRHLAAEIR